MNDQDELVLPPVNTGGGLLETGDLDALQELLNSVQPGSTFSLRGGVSRYFKRSDGSWQRVIPDGQALELGDHVREWGLIQNSQNYRWDLLIEAAPDRPVEPQFIEIGQRYPFEPLVYGLPVGTRLSYHHQHERDHGGCYTIGENATLHATPSGHRLGTLRLVNHEDVVIHSLPVADLDEIDTCQAGSVIQRAGQGGPLRHLTKLDDNRWRFTDAGGTTTIQLMRESGLTYYWEKKIMTATQHAPHAVGDTVTIDQLRECPIGTGFRWPSASTRTYYVIEGERISGNRGGGVVNSFANMNQEPVTIVSLPDSGFLTLGQSISKEQMMLCPIGTVIAWDDSGTHHVVGADGVRYSEGTGFTEWSRVRTDNPNIVSFPVVDKTQLASAATGDIIQRLSGGRVVHFTKQVGDSWRSSLGGTIFTTPRFIDAQADYYWERRAVTPAVVNSLVGTPLAADNEASLPEGTIGGYTGGYDANTTDAVEYARSETGNRVVKQANGTWQHNDHPATTWSGIPSNNRWVILEVGVTNSEEVIAKMAQVERIISPSNSGGFLHARNAAFWRLGILPMPQVGDRVSSMSAFGLPDDSIIAGAGGSSIWSVRSTKGRGESEQLAGSMVLDANSSTTMWTILSLGEWSHPIYEGPNHLMRQVWDWQRWMRRRFSWCGEVEDRLSRGDLSDPGDARDVQQAPAAPLAQGDTASFPEDWDRFVALPVGATAITSGGRVMVRHGDSAIWVNTLTHLRGRGEGVGSITIGFVPVVLPAF